MIALRSFVPSRLVVPIALIVLAVSGFAIQSAVAQDTEGAGVVVSGKATSADVGLPIYPGAKPYKESTNNSDAARLGLWGGGFGFKLAVMQMESSDAPAKVADFYRKALSKYGDVLDCTNGGAKQDDSAKALTCGDDKPDKGGMLFKAGSKKQQHIVGLDPKGSGTKFSLVYLWTKED
jgi:hypothetical protein